MNDSFDISGMYGIPPRGENPTHCGSSPYMPMPTNTAMHMTPAQPRANYPQTNMGTGAQYGTNMQMQRGANGLTAEDYQDLSMQNMPSTGQRSMNLTQTTPWQQQNMPMQGMNQQNSMNTNQSTGMAGTSTQMPTGGSSSGSVSFQGQSTEYLNGFLRTQTGKMVEVEFLIGSNNIVTKRGVLTEVGSNYILIREDVTNDVIACDFYHINFVRFL